MTTADSPLILVPSDVDASWERKRQQKCAATRTYAAKNPEKIREATARWKKKRTEFYHVSVVKRRAKASGRAFDLTIDWYAEQFKKGSALSGIPFSTSHKGYSAYCASVDRIDNDLGYTMDNCRLILRAENMFKNVMSDDEMFVIAAAMIRKRENDKR